MATAYIIKTAAGETALDAAAGETLVLSRRKGAVSSAATMASTIVRNGPNTGAALGDP